ncbi:MAG: hypothetical protein Q9220_005449 [cf. Caloplaca sp. 1 TL-2023]
MFSLAYFLKRNYDSWYPKEVPKQTNAVRFGLIGATSIGLSAIITPAKSHGEVIVAAVAAREKKKATAYAKRYKIPIIHSSYQALLDDPAIDAVYIALPNAYHFEWATKALEAGKHVLLEKPAVCNSEEAAKLFRNPLLSGKHGLVLLEAFHFRFHPAWQKLLSLIDRDAIAEVHSSQHAPKGLVATYGNMCKFALGGGCLMGMGTYNVASLREIFGTEPEECLEATYTRLAPGHDKEIDRAFDGKWRFPGGAVGSIETDMIADGGYSLPLTEEFPTLRFPKIMVKHREKVVEDDLPSNQEHVVFKTMTMWNFTFAIIWHRIDVEEKHIIREKGGGRLIRTWTDYRYIKEYAGENGSDSWTSYRHQLEAFVNRVRGRPDSGVWVESEDSVNNMSMIDNAYLKAGLPVRKSVTRS